MVGEDVGVRYRLRPNVLHRRLDYMTNSGTVRPNCVVFKVVPFGRAGLRCARVKNAQRKRRFILGRWQFFSCRCQADCPVRGQDPNRSPWGP